MSDFEKLINASDLIEWIMEAYPDWCVGVIRSIVDHINELPSAQQEQRWIPCSERLPEPLQAVIVTSTQGQVYISYIVHGEFEYGGNVVAWMPLPQPYKEDE